MRAGSVRPSLLTYPALMAADIPVCRADEVPAGADRTPHVEPARDLAELFNQRYGHTFAVARATGPAVAARVMDLRDPKSRTGASHVVTAWTVYLLDEPDTIRTEITRAVTDTAPAGR